jgi:transposase
LREFGYSKDHRFNTTQLVFALCTNGDGLPIGYELFKGNKAEVSTLIEAIEAWKKLFTIDKVCFVGDRAMFSDDNLALLEKHNYSYVIAAKLKSLPKNLKSQILDRSTYKDHTEAFVKPVKTEKDREEKFEISEFIHKGRRLIVSYKLSRAARDGKQREKMLDKLRKQLASGANAKTLMNNSGVKKYVIVSKETAVVLNEDKIQKEAAWDGFHGVITNLPESEDPFAILRRYARLWIIEDAFRVKKTNLKIRPIYHWKPRRIEAHIALCYMSFALLRHLQYRVRITQEKLSVHEILEELAGVQASIYTHKKTKDRYRVPGKVTHKASKIYKALGMHRSSDATVYLPNSSD